MIRTLSADPGITTGIILNTRRDSTFSTAQYIAWQADSTSLRYIEQSIEAAEPTEIVYEDFKHRPSLMKAELYSMQVIGVIRLYAEKHDIPIKAKYLPATAKAFWDDTKIKKIGLWKPGNGHAMDALRVMLKYQMDTDAAWFASVLPLLKD
jgi:hypothetical protein